jgi:hypothetical protein
LSEEGANGGVARARDVMRLFELVAMR